MRLLPPFQAAGLAAAAAVLSVLLAASSAQAQQCRSFKGMTPESLTAVLKGMGFSTDIAGEGDNRRVRFFPDESLESLSTFYFFSDGEAIQYYHAWTGQNVKAADLNAWNRGFRFSRAYIDSDGDPVLELDLDLAGGICEERIKDFIRTCTASYKKFKSEILK
jgi:hypothetical protein